jgi:hypothetical protein
LAPSGSANAPNCACERTRIEARPADEPVVPPVEPEADVLREVGEEPDGSVEGRELGVHGSRLPPGGHATNIPGARSSVPDRRRRSDANANANALAGRPRGPTVTTADEARARDGRDRRRWTLAVFAFVALEGATLQVQGAVLPVVREEFATPAWQLGLVAPAGTVGFLVLVAAVGALAGRVDARRLLLVGVAGTGLSVVATGAAPAFGAFLVVLVVRGAFAGVGRGSDRPLLSHLYRRSRASASGLAPEGEARQKI